MATMNAIGNGVGATTIQAINISGNAATATTASTVTSVTASQISDSTSPGRAVLTAADVAAQRTALGVSAAWQELFESTTARTLAVSDANSTITCVNTTANTTITIPLGSTLIPVGSKIAVISNTGNFVVNLALTGGVTLVPSLLPSIGPTGRFVIEKLAADTWQVLSIYEEYLHVTNWSGIWASPQAGNLSLTRIGRFISVTMPAVTSTANTAVSIAMVTALPLRFRTAGNTETRPLVVSNNSATASGAGTIIGGAITVFGNEQYGAFTASGTGGFFAQNFSYTL
jgi:hypothetical protein